MVPAPDEFGRIALHPTPDRVRKRQRSLSHHFDDIARARFVAQISAHTKNDNVAVKVTVGERPSRLLRLFIADPQIGQSDALTEIVDRFLHHSQPQNISAHRAFSTFHCTHPS